jgi:hypothetical protein
VTDVPTTVTVMLVVAMVEMPAADHRSVAMTVGGTPLTLFTRPVITAPVVLDARTLVGLAGVTDVLAPSPQAAEILVAATRSSRTTAVANVEFMRFLLCWLEDRTAILEPSAHGRTASSHERTEAQIATDEPADLLGKVPLSGYNLWHRV